MSNTNSRRFIMFRAEVKKQNELRGWTYKDLARETGYARATIKSVMCGQRNSDKLIRAVANALDIPENLIP